MTPVIKHRKHKPVAYTREEMLQSRNLILNSRGVNTRMHPIAEFSPLELIAVITEEHRLIARAAEIAVNVSTLSTTLNECPMKKALPVLNCFFQDFCSAIHRPREDKFLFLWLSGFASDSIANVLETLYEDHAFSDELLGEIAEIAREPLSDELVMKAETLLGRYGRYLLQHMNREEQMLFPLIRLCLQHSGKEQMGDTSPAPPPSLAARADAALYFWERELERLRLALFD